MVSPRICVKLCVAALFGNALFLVVIHTGFLKRHTRAVREHFIAVDAQLAFIESEQIINDFTEEYAGAYTLPPESAPNCDNSTVKKKRELDVSKGMWDKSHVFKVYPFVVSGNKWSDLVTWNVCLSTQCSAEMLFWVTEQVKTWKGPMSVSVFVPDMDYTVANIMIQYMRTCFIEIRNRVTFHMVHPDVMPPVFIDAKILEYDCKRPEEVNKELVKILRTKELIKTLSIARYPQNLMRNTARQGCPSKYCFTPDVDMLSIPSFSNEINHFVAQPEILNCKKCAFVIPTYEISVKAPGNPVNKRELLTAIKDKNAQRFHVRVFANNQANSDLAQWEGLTLGGRLAIAYNVTTWKSHWEPIYVTKANVPMFDERFIGYGFTRNSQVYEMRMAGFSWHILDNAFLTHRGFQSKKSHSRTRKRQIAENNGRYNIFVRELCQKYGVQFHDEDAKKAHGASKSKKRTRRYRRKTIVDSPQT